MIDQLCGPVRTAWRNGLGYETRRASIAFLVLAPLFYGVCLALPDLRELLLGQVLSSMDGLGVIQDDGTVSALGLFSNNLQACMFIMLYGLIPFLQLPALTLGINAMMLGVLAAWYTTQGVSLLIYLALILPHGIFELPALALTLATGLFVCGQLTRRCRVKEGAFSLWDCILLMGRMLLVVTPLLAAAAVVEAYVTPLVASLFL